jgi:hypothetical protein
MKKVMYRPTLLAGVIAMNALPAQAHGPIFSLGPETIYKDGMETQLEYHRANKKDETENQLVLGLDYGITQDWTVSAELPYASITEDGINNQGLGNIALGTTFRLWKHNALGMQDSVSAIARAVLDTAKANDTPALTPAANDFILGLAYGRESLIWQHWASVSYRLTGTSDVGIERGDRVSVDAVIGWRAEVPQYYTSDTLWMVELNSESTQRSAQNNTPLTDTGGTELFISPGVIWSYRNTTIKGGVQLPVYHDLNGEQSQSNYRLKLAFELIL